MIFKFVDPTIDNADYEPKAHNFDKVQVQFPEINGSSSAYQFASFSLTQSPSEEAAKNAKILQIGFESMYDLVNFVQEMEKTLGYAMLRTDYAMARTLAKMPIPEEEHENPDKAEESRDEIPSSEADKS